MAPTTTPSRLPQRPTGRAARQREVRTGVLAVLGLLAVLVAVPALLIVFVGNPIPTSLPDRGTLTAPVTATTLIKVLGLALWVAWAHFAVCVLAEWTAARRGRGTPAEVPLGGGSQQLARRLVASALLLAGAATLIPGAGGTTPAASDSPGGRAVTSASAPAQVLDDRRGPALAGAVSASTADAMTPDPAAVAAKATATAAAPKTYVVQPPHNRRYDTLWDIADRTLGDPLRYREIHALNHDRVQDDGRKLVDANLIHPGWVLQMPADAQGPGVSTPAVAPPARPTAPAAPAAPAEGAAAAAAVSLAAAAAPTAMTPATTTPAPGTQTETSGLSAERLLLGGGLLAAGVLLALSARRGPYASPSEATVEQQLRLAATPGRADLLDRALRSLAAACAETGRALPEIAVAYCDDSELLLSLVGSAPAPPAPWRVVADGRGWAVSSADLPEQSPDVAAPYPALAAVAISEGADVLIDLEAAPGLVSLEGDPMIAREVATSLVVELATNLWSDGVQVTAVGFGDDLAAAAPGRIEVTDALEAILPALEADSRAATKALEALRVDGVLSGRLVRDAGRRPPRVVLLSGPPTPEQSQRLDALVRDVRTPLAVLCVGATTAARWRFTVEADGRLDLGVLGVRALARRLPREAYLPMLEALRGADASRDEAAATITALSPRAALEETQVVVEQIGAAPATTATRPRASGAAGAEVRLLGPVDVQASGPIEDAARPLLTELVVAAALHPEGLHEAVLRSEVWPRGVGDDVLAGTLEKAQQWLGTDPSGTHRLRRDEQGRWVLGQDVHCDWDVLREAAASPRGATERAGLERGLAFVRGPAFSAPTHPTRVAYGSLVFHRSARDARVVGTAVARRAASLATGAGDHAAAEAALRAGLTLIPTAEPLWRDLLRLVAADRARAGEVAQELFDTLGAHGVRPEAESEALVQQILPGHTADARLG